jgi:hypothetical protein
MNTTRAIGALETRRREEMIGAAEKLIVHQFVETQQAVLIGMELFIVDSKLNIEQSELWVRATGRHRLSYEVLMFLTNRFEGYVTGFKAGVREVQRGA